MSIKEMDLTNCFMVPDNLSFLFEKTLQITGSYRKDVSFFVEPVIFFGKNKKAGYKPALY